MCGAPPVNLISNGGFEVGWQPGPVKYVPRWQVRKNDIKYGSHKDETHCTYSPGSTLSCAPEGQSFLDLCGNKPGRIRQTFQVEHGAYYNYEFKYAINGDCMGDKTAEARLTIKPVMNHVKNTPE